MNSKERCINAARLQKNDRMPVFFLNRDTELSDILMVCPTPPSNFKPTKPGESEWGFIWQSHDETMGQPKFPPLEGDMEKIKTYQAPNPYDSCRYDVVRKLVKENPDKYIIGGMGITGFNMATFLRGFDSCLEDLYLEPEYHESLLDIVFNYEFVVIEKLLDCGVDAVAFYDDLGAQSSLLMSPDKFREFYKPRYKKQFDLIHNRGKDVYFHSCGHVLEIIEDFIEIGVNIINLNQPDLFGIETLSNRFGGRICFCCPCDHQTVAIKGTPEEITIYAHELYNKLNVNNGFIAMIEEYSSIGMSETQYQAIKKVFLEIRDETNDEKRTV